MHTKKHGKSKSRKPIESAAVPAKMSEEEIRKTIGEYMKKGMGPALVGQHLKDKHGVLYVKNTLKKRLTAVMGEQGYRPVFPQDMLDLMRRAVNLRRHIERNKQDMHNKTRLVRVESKIWRLARYYKREGVLPQAWKYDPAQAALVVKS